MKPHEIYQAVDPALIHQMLDWFREHDRNVYRSAVQSLAQTRKMRLQFLQKKPLPEQYAWIVKTLKWKGADQIGEHLVQAWMMAGHKDMLATFCDAMGIEHDEGSVTGELPESLDSDKLDAAVDKLLAEHDPMLVTLYLTVFNRQRYEGWPTLSEKLEKDERLVLS